MQAGQIFSEDIYVAAGQASPEDALSTAEYPARGSFIDVSGDEWVNVVTSV